MSGGFACLFADGGGPLIALPVEALGGGRVGHALPPDAAVGGEGDVGEDGVAGEGCHGVGIGFCRGAWSYAEEACLGVDGSKLAGSVWFNPGYVVADRPDLPSVEASGRDHHGEVGLATG